MSRRVIAIVVLVLAVLVVAVFLLSPRLRNTNPDASGDSPEASLQDR